MIYVIQAENGVIKIGNAQNPFYRFQTLLFGSPLQLRLVAVLPGDFRGERELHKRFEKSRRHNEWFAPDGDVLQFLAEVWGQGLGSVEDFVTDFEEVRRTKKEVSAAKRRLSHLKNWSDPEYRTRQTMWREQLRKTRNSRASQ